MATKTADADLTMGQVAAVLGVSKRTVGRYIDDGFLHPTSKTLGGHRRFHPAVVRHLKQQMRAAQ